MTRETLLELAARVEAATGPEKTLNREIALVVGWVRQTPSEAGRKNPAWFHPSDCRDGKVVMDSLHGTDVWRDPLAYTASLDAAMTLVPEGWDRAVMTQHGQPSAYVNNGQSHFVGVATRPNPDLIWCEVKAATEALALCAAALKARAAP